MSNAPVGSGRWLVICLLAAMVLLLVSCVFTIANAQTGRTATIEFQAVTHYTDGTEIAPGTPITYVVYQGSCGGSDKQPIGTITETGMTVDSGLQRGGNYGWHIVAVVNGEASDPSNEDCKSFRVPTTVTITVT